MSFVVAPHVWNELNGVWVSIQALDDPLLRVERHRVTVHRDHHDHVWVEVSGNNAGVKVRTVPPDTMDFAISNGEPL
jgi:hypothetical protein